MSRSRICSYLLWILIAFALSCAPYHTPQRPALPAKSPHPKKVPHISVTDTLAPSPDTILSGLIQGMPALSRPVGPGFASAETIRVLLAQGMTAATFSSADSIDLHTRSQLVALPGRINCSLHGDGGVSFRFGARGIDVALPCTLYARNGNAMALGPYRYRGAMAIMATGKCTIVNIVSLEDYLRGVVPLEMGRRDWSELEALKAQAVTARTYALKRKGGRRAQPYDLAATIADQVYGGADAETPQADSAVGATRDLVLVWHDSLATVYYHSTCGGYTAAVDEVWNKPHCDYLRSESDAGPYGHPWCEFSPQFEWQESWDAATIAAIVGKTSASLFPNSPLRGKLRKITVVRRFRCGRIASCTLVGSDGSVTCGGDRLRALLRRGDGSGPLLRSANFLVETNGPSQFVLRGKGYGHGVGMCQMGALGRARQGQRFQEILAAYFHGTRVQAWNRERFAGR